MELFIRPVRIQLGAEELVELGRISGQGIPGRLPFLVDRYQLGRSPMGDRTPDAQGYITELLALELETLASLLGVSVDSLSHGANVTFIGLEVLLDNAPVLGRFLSQILLLGNATVRYGLSMPAPLAHGLGGILSDVASVLSEKNSGADNQRNSGEALDLIAGQAPQALQDGVRAMLGQTAPVPVL